MFFLSMHSMNYGTNKISHDLPKLNKKNVTCMRPPSHTLHKASPLQQQAATMEATFLSNSTSNKTLNSFKALFLFHAITNMRHANSYLLLET